MYFSSGDTGQTKSRKELEKKRKNANKKESQGHIFSTNIKRKKVVAPQNGDIS